MLSTPSSENRFDFSGRQDLYTAYIPWAVAFGCADVWAAKYRTETGAEPPVPTYFPVGGSWGHGDPTSSMVDSFSDTMSSAISSYEATQRSSSSGGGAAASPAAAVAAAEGVAPGEPLAHDVSSTPEKR